MAGFSNERMYALKCILENTAPGEWVNVDDGTDVFGLYNSHGTPEGVVAADIGSLCTDTTNGALYIKTTDTANTGWVDITMATTDIHAARYIVSAGGTADGANYTTIAAAYADAVIAGAPQDIFIQPGTYVEDITLVDGVNLVAFSGDAATSSFSNIPTPSVIIQGTITASYLGTCTLSGIMCKTNGSTAINITGSNSLRINLVNSGVWAADATGLTCTNSSALMSYYNSFFFQEGANAYFAGTNGSAVFNWTKFNNSSTPADSTVGSGTFQFNNCNVSGLGITTASTGQITAFNSRFTHGNNTLLTMVGTGNSQIHNCHLDSGSAVTGVVGAGCNLTITNTTVETSNTNAFTGAGTLNYGSLTFRNVGTSLTVTTQTQLTQGPLINMGSGHAGITNRIFIFNNDNTNANSSAAVILQTGGTSSGDPYIRYNVAGATPGSITTGRDNSDNSFKITNGTTPSSGTIFSKMTTDGEFTMPVQPAFLATLQTSDLNVTGNGATYTLGGGNALTEAFDQGGDFATNGVFTAPVTGRYVIGAQLVFGEITAAMTAITMNFVTTSLTYPFNVLNPAAIRQVASAPDIMSVQGHILVNMTAGDTFTVNSIIAGGAGNTADCIASAGRVNMYGFLFC